MPECGRPELAALVAALVAMALAAFVDHGHYSSRALGLLTVALAALATAAWRASHPSTAVADPERPLLGALLAFLLVGLCDVPGYDLHDDAFTTWFRALQGGVLLATALGATRLRDDRAWRALFAAGVAVGFGLRAGLLIASPDPQIDVFTQFQHASAHLLQGLNPYTEPIPDTPGAGTFGYRVVAYSYPPAGLLPMALAWATVGDVRLAGVAAEALAAVALYAIARGAGVRVAQLLVMLLLFHPRGLYVIEQAWNEPLLVGAAGAYLYLSSRDPGSGWTALSLGAWLSLKQYLVFFAAAALFARERRRLALPALAVVLATWLPFFAWDPGAALQNGLLFQLRTAFRPDGLTLFAPLHAAFGWTPGKGTALVVGSAVAALAIRTFGGREPAAVLYVGLLATAFAFFFGTQAFCNYFYFLGALLLFLVALRLSAVRRCGR